MQEQNGIDSGKHSFVNCEKGGVSRCEKTKKTVRASEQICVYVCLMCATLCIPAFVCAKYLVHKM